MTFDAELASRIDHTLLKPDAQGNMIDQLCDEAVQYGFKSVCVQPIWIAHAKKRIGGKGPLVATVIGFPLGANLPLLKVIETQMALEEGADEIDMVLQISKLKSGGHFAVKEEIAQVVEAARQRAVKVIFENGLLSMEEKIAACRLAEEAGARFVKTATGFGPSGATQEDVALMRKHVGPDIGVKAAGGIRDWQTAQAMVLCGANRLGTSASVAIVTSAAAKSQKAY
ncbi:MAG: deoxyribose-phosphate aldolase [Parachlamydiales bacterium]|nr:deoxyribose-phosphate aldolase [Candidatus Acheromyda pituitae]